MTNQARLSQVESGYKDRLEKEMSASQKLEKVMRSLTSTTVLLYQLWIIFNIWCLALVTS